jgi:hypothetical protein
VGEFLEGERVAVESDEVVQGEQVNGAETGAELDPAQLVARFGGLGALGGEVVGWESGNG